MSKRLRRWVIAGGVVCAAAISSSIALATSTGGASGTQDPLAGISALSPTPTSLDTASAAVARGQNAIAAARQTVGLASVDQARMLPGTVDGSPVYLIPTDKGLFCMIAADTEVCSPPLTAQRPAFLVGSDDDGPGGAPPTFFGIAMDGVTQITASVDGSKVSVPVTQNLFVFHGSSATTINDMPAVSATFADGTSVPLP